MNRFVTMVVGLVFAASAAQAASNTWTGTAGATWDTGITASWTDPTTWSSGDDATFDVTGVGSISIDSAGVTANSVTINTAGYTFGGGTLTLAGPSMTVSADGTISSALAGTAGLTKAGSGTLTLTGTNTYSGGTTISSGTLRIGNALVNGTIGSGNYTLTSGGTLYLDYATASLSTWGNILGAGTLELNSAQAVNGTAFWGQAALPAGFSGTLQIDKGRVYTAASGSFGNGTGIVVTAGGQLGMWTGGTFGQNFSIAGTGYGESSHEVALRFAGSTVSGNVVLSAAAAIGVSAGSGTITGVISGGSGASLTIGASGETGAMILSGSSANTFAGTTVVKYGTLVLGKPNGVNAIGGNLTWGSGATVFVQWSADEQIPDTAIIDGTGSPGLALELLGHTETVAGITGTGWIENRQSESGINSSGTLVVSNSANYTYSGTLRDNGGGSGSGVLNLTKAGTGTQTLSGATSFTGLTTITGGLLVLANTAALQSSILNYNNFGGTLSFEALTAATLGSIQGEQDLALTNAASAAVALTVGNGNGSSVYGGVLSGAGSLVKVGTGTLTLTNASTYGGVTTINAGVLSANNGAGSATGSGLTTVASGGTLAGTGTVATVSLASGGKVTPGNSGIGNLNVNSLALNTGGLIAVDLTVSSNDTITVGTAGGLTNNGATFMLYSNGTASAWAGFGTFNLIQYSGPVMGTAALSALTVGNPAAGLSYAFVTNGVWLQVVVSSSSEATWDGGGLDNNWMTATNWASDVVPPDMASLVFAGSTRLSNMNDMSANTRLGGLTFGPGAGAFTLDGNAVNLVGDVVNNSPAAQMVNLPLVLDVGDRVINASNGVITVSGAIGQTNGTWGVVKAGTNALTLAGVNTYAGATTIASGLLEVGGAGQLGGGNYSAAITNGGLFRYNSSANQTFGGVISGTGAVVKASSGTLTLKGANTHSGGTTVNGGTLALWNGSTAVIRGPLVINGGATATAGTDSWSLGFVAGSIVTPITITGGTLTFVGTPANGGTSASGITLTGGTINGVPFDWYDALTTQPTLTTLATNVASVVSGGINLRLDGGYLTLNVASGSVPDGTDLLVSGAIVGSNGNMLKSGAGTAVLGGANTYGGWLIVTDGTVILTAPNSYSGGTTVNAAGRLQVGAGGTTGALPGNVTDNGQLAFNRSDSVTYGGVVSGSGSLTQAGSGTLTLTGMNTYTGTTTVASGTLRLGSTNVLNQAGSVTLAGGTLDPGVATNQLGELTVAAGANTILVGSTSLSFANSSTNVWTGTLSVTGTLGPQSLRFGTDRTGLTPAQLAVIDYGGKRVRLDDQGYVVVATGFLLLVQ